MYWQQRYLKYKKDFDSSTTGLETVDLPKLGLLSGLELRVEGTNGATVASPDVWIHDRLKKIELIVNGSKVVKSFSGNQLLADMLYKKTPIASHDMKNLPSGSGQEVFYINFGRFYHDPEFMLDLSKVNDPELRIDYDFGMDGANGWDNGVAMAAAPSLTVIPHILREPLGAPRGYIKTSEVYRFTSGNSKKENMKLPIGPLYAMLYLQCFYASHGFVTDIDHVELNLNNDAIIPYRVDYMDILQQLARKFGLFELSQQCYLTGGQAYPFPIEAGEFYGRSAEGQDALLAGGDIWGCAANAQYTVLSTQAAGDGSINFYVTYKGVLPFSVAAIPVFDLMDEGTWIDSKVLGDFWLRVEQDASAESSIVKLLADEVVTEY
ncbi:hypothetical protein ES708_24186 [subsurface metagenome]